jgi:PKHD-type hydroxylase
MNKKTKLKIENKNILKNSAWNLYTDHVELYAYWDKLFSKDECKEIVKVAKNKGLIKGTTFGKSNIRKSKISWLYAADELDWVFRKLTDAVLDLNERFFKFDIFGFHEGLQFTNYKAPSNKYGRHVDRSLNTPTRKLSLSVQLTDPKKYVGGDLLLYSSEKPTLVTREQGSLVLFPSYVLHEVTTVTKGERNSLVAWITGKPFK